VLVAQAQLTTAQADLTSAQSETAVARRQLEEIDILIDFATLKAPFAGMITHRDIDPGDLVRATSESGTRRRCL
jgi:HlyD family secretion protein